MSLKLIKPTMTAAMAASLFLLSGCGPSGPQEPAMSQLEIRQVQTRTFSDMSLKQVMRAMLHVLQDEGYMIKNANSKLGLIAASKELSIESAKERNLAILVYGSQARWKKNATIEVAAQVSEFGKDVRVRVNFQSKTIDNLGAPVSVEQMLDKQIYLDFFNQVSKGLYIEGEGI